MMACIDCGEVLAENDEMPCYFSASAGGIVCDSCKAFYADCIKICYTTRYTMQYIFTSPANRLFHFKVTPNVEKELTQVCKRYIPYYIDKEFKTLDFLERIEGMH